MDQHYPMNKWSLKICTLMKPWGILRFEVQVKERSHKWRQRSSPRGKPERCDILNAWQRDTRDSHHPVNDLCYLWSVPPEVTCDCNSHSGYWKKTIYLGLAMTAGQSPQAVDGHAGYLLFIHLSNQYFWRA